MPTHPPPPSASSHPNAGRTARGATGTDVPRHGAGPGGVFPRVRGDQVARAVVLRGAAQPAAALQGRLHRRHKHAGAAAAGQPHPGRRARPERAHPAGRPPAADAP
eukprot:277030-Chlamydomonas_euryale.AAC.1